MRYAGLLISFAGFLFVNALLLNAPVALVLWLARRRIAPRTIRAVLACGFAAATFYMLYRIEWFDVWRQGMPSLTYLAGGYLPWVAAAGAVGWAIAARMWSPARHDECAIRSRTTFRDPPAADSPHLDRA